MSLSPSENEPSLAASVSLPKDNFVRRLYRWVLHWADTPYGTPALALISFAESSFFPIPPDVLQVALSVSRPKRAFYYAAVSTVASVAGGVAGWYIGHWCWAGMSEYFFNYVPGFTEATFAKVQTKYEQNAFLALFGAAFTPIPFKVFTIAGGVFNISLGTLIWASILGRGLRFFSVATAIYFFGEQAKALLEKYFEIITFGLFALMIAGFLAIKAMS
jgi:membrane protein YqaA with SNARE-associated domain